MATQLRVFTINKGRLDDFVGAWLDGVYPLRQKHGYRIDGAWTIRERNQFVWLLTYDGPEDWEAKDRAYYAAPERAAVDPDPAQWIARAEHVFLTPVLPPGGRSPA